MSDHNPNTSVIDMDGITYAYPNAPSLALAGVTFKIGSGEHVAIVGRSGSGKTTLLSMLGLLETPTSGSYRLAGRQTVAAHENERSRWRADNIGFIFQSFHLMEEETILSNVSIGLRYFNLSRKETKSRAREAIERVGLKGRELDRPTRLSGGERQRVAIARAVVKNPTVLLADEPTGNLDIDTADRIMTLFHELRSSSNLTLVMVTHDQELANRAESQLYVSDGRVTEQVVP